MPFFVLDERLLAGSAPARSWYLRGALAELDRSLRVRGSRLLVRRGDARTVVPEVARQLGAEVVFASDEVTPYGRRRDAAVAARLEQDGRTLELHEGLLLVEPHEVHTAEGRPYTVFTPFWRALGRVQRRALLPAPVSMPAVAPSMSGEALPEAGPAPLPGLPPQVKRARASDSSAGSTEVSPATGPIAMASTAWARRTWVRTCTSGRSHRCRSRRRPRPVELMPSPSRDSWPGASSTTTSCTTRAALHASPPALESAFRTEADDPGAVAAWREGRTGIPAVDAAMRQLTATGWMSNRARLVTASFLTRHLLMHPRIGERHFMRHLIDGDVANNRGGWQWTAGIGLDAQPWFRIFNPVRQGQRFDPDGRWVRRWVPELAAVPDRFVHAPWESPAQVSGYPEPIVELAFGRERALAAFKAATQR